RDVKAGDRIAIKSGTNVWPKAEQPINYSPASSSPTLETVAVLAGVSSSTVIRHMKGRYSFSAGRIDVALRSATYLPGHAGKRLSTRSVLQSPRTLNAEAAWLLGYFVGDGNRTKSG